MQKIKILIVIIIALSISCVWVEQKTKVGAETHQVNRLDGSVYEFISSASETIKPVKQVSKRNNDDWLGRYYFVNGKFSRVMMKKKRTYLNDPDSEDKLGYYSDAGDYKISGDTLVLTKIICLHPFDVGRSEYYKIKEQDGLLHLYQDLEPNIHNMSEGSVHVILQKID